jgi:glutamine synthetase
VVKDAFGAFVPAYLKLKRQDWNEYAGHLTTWERDTTLDC